MTILDTKLLTANGKVVAIRAHDGSSPAGYYAILAEADEYDEYSPAEKALMRIAGMSWQNYTHYTTVLLDPTEISFHDTAKDGQIKLFWCEILGYDTFECVLDDHQIKNAVTKEIPDYIMY